MKKDFCYQLPGEKYIKYLEYQNLREEIEQKDNKTNLSIYSWKLILKYSTCFSMVCLSYSSQHSGKIIVQYGTETLDFLHVLSLKEWKKIKEIKKT